MLTKQQKKRLAKEARKLAMECVEGGPEMSYGWCGCAIGTSLKRAGLWTDEEQAMALGWDLECRFSQTNSARVGVLTLATTERVYHGNPTAVVFPLLAWADFLESAAE